MAAPNKEEAALTMNSGVSVLRLPDIKNHGGSKTNISTASEGKAALNARGKLRDVAILTRMELIDTNELEVLERARIPHLGAKPLMFNVASMETLRRLYVVGEKSVHTNEMAKLLAALQRQRLADRHHSLVLIGPGLKPPRGNRNGSIAGLRELPINAGQGSRRALHHRAGIVD